MKNLWEEFDNGEYRKCSYMTNGAYSTQMRLNNSRYDYSDSENIDQLFSQLTLILVKEIQLFPNNH